MIIYEVLELPKFIPNCSSCGVFGDFDSAVTFIKNQALKHNYKEKLNYTKLIKESEAGLL